MRIDIGNILSYYIGVVIGTYIGDNIMDLGDLKAVEAVLNVLEPFTPEEQARIVRWVVEKLGPSVRLNPRGGWSGTLPATGLQPPEASDGTSLDGFQSAADLMAAANPATDSQRALVVAAFLQCREGHEELTGLEINSALKHLGHPVANITDAITTLKNARPSLMLQTRKSGSTKQARKRYKVTVAGLERVRQMLNGDEDHAD